MRDLLNLDTYQVETLDRDACESWRQNFHDEGLLVLPNFVSKSGLAELLAEARSLAGEAYYRPVEGNIYLSPVDPTWPEDHPGRRLEPTEVGVVAADRFPANSPLRKIFEWQPFVQFLEVLIGRGKLYKYKCPLGYLNLTVMREANYLRWHFDQSDFVVSIPLQAPEDGGVYEYVRMLRTPDQPNHAGVHRLLDGDRSDVKTLEAAPGSLVLFEGRYTAHRVTPVAGNTLRLGALLGYVDTPEATSTPYLRQIRYGREH